MRRLIAFVATLAMPLILVIGGGAVIGWAVNTEWEILGWIGAGMIVAGLIWGFFLFLWASNGSF